MATEKNGGEIAERAPMGSELVQARTFSDDALRAVSSWDDALAVAAASGLVLPDEPEIGTGFTKVDEKDAFIGVPLILMEWRFVTSDDYTNADGSTSEFVAVSMVTGRGEKVVITDGSTGIYRQLLDVTRRRIENPRPGVSPNALLKVEGGLRKSEYGRMKDTGEIVRLGTPGSDKAVTHYLAN